MTEAQHNGLLSALRAVLLLFGAWLAQNGDGQTGIYHDAEMTASAILIIGPAIWGIYAAVSNLFKAHAVGVQAGINLTVSGNALASDGKTVVAENNGATPPKPVTYATAQEIIANFGPKPSDILRV